MVSVAYLVFTFLACILGAGFGLAIFRARQVKLAASGKATPDLKTGNEEDKWDAIQRWQLRENHAFAGCVLACAVFPIVVAAAGWTSRSEVVSSICSGLTTVAMQSPLCF